MNDLGVNTKNTLMNAVERLTSTVNRYEDLAALSEIMISKFQRSEMLASTKTGDKPSGGPSPDLVGLFNGINDRLELLLNKIGSNLERAVGMID